EKALASNLTLQQWLQRMQGIHGIDERLSVLVRQLENKQYGADQTDAGIVGLAQETSRILHQQYLQYVLPKYFKFKLPLKFLQ
ncbi:MAG: hypothetical protein WC236_15960, partial [Gallionellaceae bacterium]